MKLAKLSLAAIMAAGVFSVANATPLEDAIKGVDVSGYIRYRYYSESNEVAATDRHRFTVPVFFKIPAADKITVGVGMFAENNEYANGSAAPFVKYGNSYTLDRLWFNYADNGFNLKVGRQLMGTPLTDGGITGNYGDGALATYAVNKNLTLAAAAFVKSNAPAVNDNHNIYVAAAIGSFSGINAQLWAFSVEKEFDSVIFAQLSGSYEGLSLMGQGVWSKAASELGLADDTGSFYGVKAAYKYDMAKVCAGYTTTSKNNGIYTLNADGRTIHAGKQLYYKTVNAADTDVYFVGAKAAYEAYNFGVGYAGVSSVSGSTLDGADEIWVDVGYKFSKKMKVSAYYSAMDLDKVDDKVAGGDNNEFRVEVKYSF